MLFISFAPNVIAERSTYTSIGNYDCRSWSAVRKTASQGSGVEILSDAGAKAWVLGFVTALNITAEGDRDFLSAIDADTIFHWMDKFCSKNPRKDTIDGSIELLVELRKITK